MTLQQRRTALKGLLAGTLSPLLSSCSARPSRPASILRNDPSPAVAYLQALFTHEIRQQNLIGLSVAVVHDQQLTWTQGFGWADRANGVYANSDTIYRVGSISKLFTVAAALQFAERGELNLDAPINHILPEFRTGSRFGTHAITARQLMTHHAGLPRDLLRGMWSQTPESGFESIMDFVATSEPAYPPGELWSYSNVGMSVLGAAIERLAGMPFAEHLQRALLQPLGMDNASFSCLLPSSPQFSKAYFEGEEAIEPGLRDIAAGGLNASVRDLGRWLMMIFAQGRANARPILQATTVAEMLRVQNTEQALDFDLKMGLGWMLTPPDERYSNLGPVASHDGATINHRSVIIALPQQRLGVALLCNSANAQTLAKLAETTLAVMLEATTGQKLPEIPSEADWRPTEMSESTLSDLAGAYVTPTGIVRISHDGKRLNGQLPGFRFMLEADTSGALHIQKDLFGFIPLPLGELEKLSFRQKTVSGRRILLVQRGTNQMLFGEHLDQQNDVPTNPAWREMLGQYFPETSSGEFSLIERLTLFESDGHLHLHPTLSRQLTTETSGALLIQTLDERLGVIVEKLSRYGEPVSIHLHKGEKTLQFAGITFRKHAI